MLAATVGCAGPAYESGATSQPGRRDKEVVCQVERLPNYILHLTAAAGLPHPANYPYASAVQADDLQALRAQALLLQWGPGVTGELAPFFVFLPCYLGLADEFELAEYFRVVGEAFRGGTYLPLREHYREAHERLAWWLFDFEGFFHSRSESYREHLREVSHLAYVFERNFQRYDEEVWRQVEPELDVLAGDLNGRLWSLDLLGTWERATGLRFAAEGYQIVLTAAPGGTGITGLGYERSLLSVDADRERLIGLITHEVGAHLLVELFREVSSRDAASGQLDWTTYAAYEGLTLYYTRQILPGFETQIQNDVEKFAGIYRQLQDQEPGASARRLLGRGLQEYRAGQW